MILLIKNDIAVYILNKTDTNKTLNKITSISAYTVGLMPPLNSV